MHVVSQKKTLIAEYERAFVLLFRECLVYEIPRLGKVFAEPARLSAPTTVGFALTIGDGPIYKYSIRFHTLNVSKVDRMVSIPSYYMEGH